MSRLTSTCVRRSLEPHMREHMRASEFLEPFFCGEGQSWLMTMLCWLTKRSVLALEADDPADFPESFNLASAPRSVLRAMWPSSTARLPARPWAAVHIF